MPFVQSVDYANRRIYLSVETVSLPSLDTMDVYREVRSLRRTTESHRKFRSMIVAGGNIQKTATTFTASYVQLLNGCRIVPFDVLHRLVVSRDTFSDDGASGVECFDRAAVVENVDIDYQVAAVEIRTVATGGGLSPEQSAKIAEIHRRLGLDAAAPLTTTPTSIIAGDLDLVITGDGETTSTVTRQ
jgi:hypothetical protein